MPERDVDRSYAERIARLEARIRYLENRAGTAPPQGWKFEQRGNSLIVRNLESGTVTVIANG